MGFMIAPDGGRGKGFLRGKLGRAARIFAPIRAGETCPRARPECARGGRWAAMRPALPAAWVRHLRPPTSRIR